MNKFVSWVKSNQIIIIILIIGTFLRLFHLDFQSVWLDEVHTLNESNPKLSFQEVHETLLIAEPHPPLYFFIMNVFFNLFGYTTFVARLFSALIGITGIYAIYLLGKELFSKKVGIYSMILLSVNYFHIYYSQDARMYALLFFTTTLSFYFLTKLIKSPTIRNTVLFSLTSTLMIYSHFFALFTLIAQYLILLYFIIFPFNTTRIKFLKYTFLSGILTVLLYIPTYKLILKTTQMQSIWIQMPDKDAYTQFFKDFFGQSEMILFLIIPILLLYFIKLFNVKSSKKFNINPNEEKHVFSFIILFIWIIITLLIPLIRTHTSLPMLVNRYFINVLPAILIVLAIGIYLIKNKIIRNVIISIIFIFSITDIFIVKSYYTNTTKTQFREASSFVLENNKLKEPIFTTLSWYFQYFIKDQEIINKPIDDLINEIKKDTSKLAPFWYVNAHGNKFEISKENEQFLSDNYVINKNFEGYDAWAKSFIPKKMFKQNVNIKKYQPYNKNQYGKNIKAWVEHFDFKKDSLKISGWSILEKVNTQQNDMYIVLFNNKEEFSYIVNNINRPDITVTLNDGFNYDNSGFEAKIDLKKLKPGKYKVGILINNSENEGFFITEKQIVIN